MKICILNPIFSKDRFDIVSCESHLTAYDSQEKLTNGMTTWKGENFVRSSNVDKLTSESIDIVPNIKIFKLSSKARDVFI